MAAPVTLSRVDPQSQPQPIVEAALRADATQLPAFAGVDLGADGYAVLRVVKRLGRAVAAPDVAKQESEQFAQAVAAAENLAYYNVLKARYKAEILVPRPESNQVAGR